MENNPIMQAANLFKAGDKQKASEILISFLDENPGNAEAWYGLALCTEENKKKSYCVKKVLEIDPTHTQARRALEKLNRVELENRNQLSRVEVPIPSSKICPNCNTPASQNCNFCDKCGYPLDNNSSVSTTSQVLKNTQSDEYPDLMNTPSGNCPYCKKGFVVQGIEDESHPILAFTYGVCGVGLAFTLGAGIRTSLFLDGLNSYSMDPIGRLSNGQIFMWSIPLGLLVWIIAYFAMKKTRFYYKCINCKKSW